MVATPLCERLSKKEVNMSKELFKKYADVLNKPFCNYTDKDWKRLNKFLDENNKVGLANQEIYKEEE